MDKLHVNCTRCTNLVLFKEDEAEMRCPYCDTVLLRSEYEQGQTEERSELMEEIRRLRDDIKDENAWRNALDGIFNSKEKGKVQGLLSYADERRRMGEF